MPVAVVTASPGDLAALYGTPEWPVLVMAAPVRASQLEEVLRLALPDTIAPALDAAPAANTSPQAGILDQRKVIPAWAVRLLVAPLMLPQLLPFLLQRRHW